MHHKSQKQKAKGGHMPHRHFWDCDLTASGGRVVCYAHAIKGGHGPGRVLGHGPGLMLWSAGRAGPRCTFENSGRAGLTSKKSGPGRSNFLKIRAGPWIIGQNSGRAGRIVRITKTNSCVCVVTHVESNESDALDCYNNCQVSIN